MHRGRAAGFTLIELLVVVTVIAIIAGMAVAGGALVAPQRRIAAELDQFASTWRYLCDESELSGRPVGMALARQGYLPMVFDDGLWVPRAQRGALGPQAWAPDRESQLWVDGDPVLLEPREPEAPQLVCWAGMEQRPFEFRLRARGLEQESLTGTWDGRLQRQTGARP